VTAIVSWNIQCGSGCDGVVDLERIARVVKAMGEADVICMQEVARNDPAIAGGADQAAELETLGFTIRRRDVAPMPTLWWERAEETLI